jgi:hypothetical protein
MYNGIDSCKGIVNEGFGYADVETRRLEQARRVEYARGQVENQGRRKAGHVKSWEIQECRGVVNEGVGWDVGGSGGGKRRKNRGGCVVM